MLPLPDLHDVFTLKKGAMPIPELTSGCIMGDLVVLYIFTPEVEDEDEEKQVKQTIGGVCKSSVPNTCGILSTSCHSV